MDIDVDRIHGPLLDSGGVCSNGPHLHMVHDGYVRIPNQESIFRAHGIDCRAMGSGVAVEPMWNG